MENSEGEKFADDLGMRLCSAANGGSVIKLRDLLSRGANVEFDAANGWRPIIYASSNGHVECAEALIQAGARLDQPEDEEGRYPLMLAVEGGHPEVTQRLLEAGADPEAKDPTGQIALLRALEIMSVMPRKGQLACVAQLLPMADLSEGSPLRAGVMECARRIASAPLWGLINERLAAQEAAVLSESLSKSGLKSPSKRV